MGSSEKLPVNLVTKADAAGMAVLVFIFFFSIYHLMSKRRRSSELPPGPSPWPIIGNLHLLGKLPPRALKDLADKYGPIMYLRLGSVPTLVVSAPEMAKHFLQTHDLVFASRPATAAGKYMAYNFKDVALAPYGDYWRQTRKICIQELFTANRIESFQSGRDEEVSEMIRSIWKESENGAKPVNVSKALMSYMTNIICRMLMGRVYRTDAPENLGSIKKLGEFVRNMSPLTGAFYIGDFISWLSWLDTQCIIGRMKKMQAEFDALMEEVIDEHIKNGNEANGERGNDFVDVLLDISERAADEKNRKLSSRSEIKALLFDMFTAGIETTAITLEWAMSETLKNSGVMARVQEEVDATVGKHGRLRACDVVGAEYLQCVVKETLRLHPPAPLLLPRESTKACTVAGYPIPAKTRVIVNAWAIGRDQGAWGEDALAFKPERFMEVDGRNANIDVRGRDFELIPFGSGRRGCPGMALALESVSLAFSHLMYSFNWRLECKDGVEGELDMSESFGVTMPRRFELFAIPALRSPGGL